MARPRVNWKKEWINFDFDKLKQSANEEFTSSLENLIGKNQTTAIRMIEVATKLFSSNVISNKTVGTSSAREQKAAAERLMKDCELLAVKLSSGCGGLYGQIKTSGIETKNLSEDLTKLSSVCRDLLVRNLFLDGKTIAEERSELATWIKFVLENEVGIKTSTYYDQEGGAGVLAKVMMLCMDEAIRFVPTSIKRDLIKAKNTPLPSKDDDYWIKLSEEEIKEAIDRANKLFG